jgi:hypothetical protein
MYKSTALLALILSAAAAWGADCFIERAALPLSAPDPAGTDGTLELRWDSGFGMWYMCWYTGRGSWVANDFDISTLSTYCAVQAIKFQSRNNWPNTVWDGFNLGVYSFSGGVPGSLLWGPKFVVPTGYSGWHEFSVNWTLPSGTYKFMAAQEQFYNYPYCDPFLIDNNPTFRGHSWQYLQGEWSPFNQPVIAPYRNLAMRVIVNDSTVNLAPTSIGRVKALYY